MTVHHLHKKSPLAVSDARAFVLDPDRAATRPQQRLLAWALLKTAYGQTLSQDGLGRIMNRQRANDLSCQTARVVA